MMKVKISVIIPVYNTANYLRECLESVLKQSLHEIEIICINDGSKDHSLEILNEMSWKDKRIKVINKSNEGVAKARNLALQGAIGEYVYFLDSDDYFPDEKVLEEMYQKAIENKVFICGGEFREDGVGFTKTVFEGNLSKYNFEKDGIVEYKDYQFDYGFTRFIYNLDFLRENQLAYFPEYTFFEDPVFFVRVMQKAGRFYGMKRCTYCYRTGYKELVWTPKKVCHLLSGLRDNIKLAVENNLNDLLYLESFRLEYDYRNAILSQVDSEAAYEIKALFQEINEYLSSGKETIEYKMFRRREEELKYEIWRLENRQQPSSYRLAKFIWTLPKRVLRKIFRR